MNEKDLDDFKSFLINYKSKYKNPFNNKNFDLNGMETYTKGIDIHKIGKNIKLIYKDLKIICKLKKEELIVAIYLIYIMQFDPFSYKQFKLFYKNKEIRFNNWKELFDVLINLNYLSEIIEFEFIFDSSSDSKNAYLYNKQIVYFFIDEDNDDFYHCNVELERWEKNEITDEEL